MIRILTVSFANALALVSVGADPEPAHGSAHPPVVRTLWVNINRDTPDAVRRTGLHVREDRLLDRAGIFRVIEAVRPGPTQREYRDPNPTR